MAEATCQQIEKLFLLSVPTVQAKSQQERFDNLRK